MFTSFVSGFTGETGGYQQYITEAEGSLYILQKHYIHAEH